MGQRWRKLTPRSLASPGMTRSLAMMTLSSGSLETDGNAAANGAGGLNQVDGLAVLAHHRHIALRQQVAQVDQHLHVRGKEAQGWNGLADENVQVGIALSRGGVEHIHRG